MLTLEKLREELEIHHNDICIVYDLHLARLVGVAEDEDDFYYIIRQLNPKGQSWYSAVGHIVSLKGLYPKDRYEYMDYLFELNGAEKTDEFLVEVRKRAHGR